MLGLRLREGLPLDRAVGDRPRPGPRTPWRGGCSNPAPTTPAAPSSPTAGRLLADAVIRDLTD